jgi:hypothetical protein
MRKKASDWRLVVGIPILLWTFGLSFCFVWAIWFVTKPFSQYAYTTINLLLGSCVVCWLPYLYYGVIGEVLIVLLVLELRFIGFSVKDGIMIFAASYLIIYETGTYFLQPPWFTKYVTNFDHRYFPELDRILTNEAVMTIAASLLTLRVLWLHSSRRKTTVIIKPFEGNRRGLQLVVPNGFSQHHLPNMKVTLPTRR